jgi:hypothetical protein
VSALACSATVSDLAVRHEVSRKFVYQQAHKARAALDDAFTATTPDAAVPRNVDHCNATRSTSLQFILYGSFFVRASTWLRQAQPFMYGTKKHRNVNDTEILEHHRTQRILNQRQEALLQPGLTGHYVLPEMAVRRGYS